MSIAFYTPHYAHNRHAALVGLSLDLQQDWEGKPNYSLRTMPNYNNKEDQSSIIYSKT